MSNVVHIKSVATNKKAMLEQASLWVVKLSAGVSESEMDEIHSWLSESPEHIQVLLDVASIWDQVSVLSELSEFFPLQEYLAQKPHHARVFLSGTAALATCLLLLTFLLPVSEMLEFFRDKTDGSIELSYETRIGQQSTVVLPDGSEVLLNTNTHMEGTFADGTREIYLLRGEGHFTVTKDPDRPFRVHANGGVVEAVGTAFSVQQSLQDGLEVIVLEGEVSFTRTKIVETLAAAPDEVPVAVKKALINASSDDSEQISLIAGESINIVEDSDAVLVHKVQPEEMVNRLAWRDGMLYFQGDSLEKVIQEVSRYTPILIEVDEKIRNIEVLGYFRTGDIEGVLLTMRDTFNLEVERLSEEHIILKSSE